MKRTLIFFLTTTLVYPLSQAALKVLIFQSELDWVSLASQGLFFGITMTLLFALNNRRTRKMVQALQPELEEGEELEDQIAVSFYEKKKMKLGKMWLTNQGLIFKPIVKKGESPQSKINYAEIKEAKTRKRLGIFNNGLDIFTKTGDKIRCVVERNEELVYRIETHI